MTGKTTRKPRESIFDRPENWIRLQLHLLDAAPNSTARPISRQGMVSTAEEIEPATPKLKSGLSAVMRRRLSRKVDAPAPQAQRSSLRRTDAARPARPAPQSNPHRTSAAPRPAGFR